MMNSPLHLDMLFDLDLEQGRAGIGLPEQFQAFYDGDLTLPQSLEDRAVASVNFVVRRDGVVDIPEVHGGGVIRGDNPADRPLMALLRAAHDAVLVGSETVASEMRHIWTPGFIYPKWGDVLREWRLACGRTPHPLNIVVSRSGLTRDRENSGRKVPLDLNHPLFQQRDVAALIITTSAGARNLSMSASPPNVRLLKIDADNFELEILRQLKTRYAVSYLLIEGGPTINGAFHARGLISDDFLTLAPGMAGRLAGSRRSTLMMGYEFNPDSIPMPTLISVRRSGSHLMVRERYAPI